jgi:uncharacterized protein YndB with AHSA1/START domain
MKLNVLLVEDFPHPVEKVWRSLTNADALRIWLMDNDFEPRLASASFYVVARSHPDGGDGSSVKCWNSNRQTGCSGQWVHNEGDPPSRVEFRLDRIGGGTRLTLSHTGEIDPVIGARLREGWPRKLADLHMHMRNVA